MLERHGRDPLSLSGRECADEQRDRADSVILKSAGFRPGVEILGLYANSHGQPPVTGGKRHRRRLQRVSRRRIAVHGNADSLQILQRDCVPVRHRSQMRHKIADTADTVSSGTVSMDDPVCSRIQAKYRIERLGEATSVFVTAVS